MSQIGPKPSVDLSQSKTEWSKAMLIRRAIWEFVFMHVVQRSPRPFGFLRKALLRLFGARIGPGCVISTGVRVLMPWNLQMGANSWIGRNVDVYNYAPITFHDNAVVSQYAYLCTGTHDYEHPHFPLTYAPITIESQAWVAAGAFIGPGVTVHEGAVVGAYAVAFKNIPAWTICGGNPCKPIKPRTIDPSKLESSVPQNEPSNE